GDAGEADEDGVDVAAELADVGRLVRRAERGPELLDDLAARVLEGLVEARHHLVAEGEVVRDGRDFPVPERLRGVGAEGHGRLARGRGRAHEELGRLALGQVVGGGARRDRRDALGVHVRRERVGLEGGQGAEDDVDSALLDQLAGSRERAGGLATAVDDRQLDAPAGERALLLLEEQLDAVLHLFAGPLSANGRDMINGLELYFEEQKYRLAGREIKLIVEDDEGKPATGLTKARGLVEGQGVHVILGPLSAAVGYAIAPYLDGKKVPTIFPIVSSEDITQRKRSPYIVRTGWTSAQPMHPFGKWVYDNLKYRKIAMIGYDFAFGWEVAAGFHRTFEEAGGQVVQKLWPPLNTPDFAPY